MEGSGFLREVARSSQEGLGQKLGRKIDGLIDEVGEGLGNILDSITKKEGSPEQKKQINKVLAFKEFSSGKTIEEVKAVKAGRFFESAMANGVSYENQIWAVPSGEDYQKKDRKIVQAIADNLPADNQIALINQISECCNRLADENKKSGAMISQLTWEANFQTAFAPLLQSSKSEVV